MSQAVVSSASLTTAWKQGLWRIRKKCLTLNYIPMTNTQKLKQLLNVQDQINLKRST